MTLLKSLLSAGLAGLLLPGTSKPSVFTAVEPAATGITYSGHAYGAYVTIPVLSYSKTLADTGPLPASGGFRSSALLTASVPSPLGGPPLVSGEVLTATTIGANGVAESHASAGKLTILPGTLAQVTVDFVRAESRATCNDVQGSSEISGLVFAGIPITVTGAANQTIKVNGVGTLYINEQIRTTGPGSNKILVRGLRLWLLGGEEIIIASAESDIDGCPSCPPIPGCNDFVTGGGWIKVGNSRANFGLVAGSTASGALSVSFNYIDHSTGMKVKATSLTAYYPGPTPWSRHLEGACTVNGVGGFTYQVDVEDIGEPGRLSDTLSVSLSNGYSAGGVLQGGNIQLHNPCP